MDATTTCSNSEQHLEYQLTISGEVIRGTKSQIQSFGIALDKAFPGEPGAPKRILNTIDPRGLKTTISHYSGDAHYTARIEFPDSAREPEQWSDFAPGVKVSFGSLNDEYVGTAGALAAAGIARLDQFPGQPGAKKIRVTIFADGTVPHGRTYGTEKQNREPGAKHITRATKDTYKVEVWVQEEEQKRRKTVRDCAEKEYKSRMCAMPRPTPLTAGLRSTAPQEAKGQLGLVWSARPIGGASNCTGMPSRRGRAPTREEALWMEAYPGLDVYTAELAIMAKAVSNAPKRRPTLRLIEGGKP